MKYDAFYFAVKVYSKSQNHESIWKMSCSFPPWLFFFFSTFLYLHFKLNIEHITPVYSTTISPVDNDQTVWKHVNMLCFRNTWMCSAKWLKSLSSSITSRKTKQFFHFGRWDGHRSPAGMFPVMSGDVSSSTSTLKAAIGTVWRMEQHRYCNSLHLYSWVIKKNIRHKYSRSEQMLALLWYTGVGSAHTSTCSCFMSTWWRLAPTNIYSSIVCRKQITNGGNCT